MKKRLKIAQIAPLWIPTPPKKYGGIERIVHYLTEELVKRGHKVTLFAPGDSKTSAKLVSIRKKALVKYKVPWSDTFWELEGLSFAFRKAKGFDIVHSHVGLRTLFFQDFIRAPVIHTFHNPVYSTSKKLPPSLKILKLHKENTNACFISKSAKKLCPIKLKNSWIVHNGIDLNLFRFSPRAKDYFLWVGRADPYKGIENAIKIAKIAKIKLYLVGKVDPERQEYFQRKIKPNLSERIKYLGELSQKRLVKLYGKAKALLYPIEWQEPFGLVMAEAQACGTPVITFKLGSTSEVVKNKKTGFVLPFLDKNKKKNIKGAVEAIKNINTIKRENCRKWVEENFTVEKMVDNYEKIYYEMLKKN